MLNIERRQDGYFLNEVCVANNPMQVLYFLTALYEVNEFPAKFDTGWTVSAPAPDVLKLVSRVGEITLQDPMFPYTKALQSFVCSELARLL